LRISGISSTKTVRRRPHQSRLHQLSTNPKGGYAARPCAFFRQNEGGIKTLKTVPSRSLQKKQKRNGKPSGANPDSPPLTGILHRKG